MTSTPDASLSAANFTAVAYGLRLEESWLKELRAAAAAAGAVLLEERSTGNGRFDVHELDVHVPEGPDALRRAVHGLPAGAGVAVVPSALRTAGRKFLILDVDSTLIQQEVIELLAAYAGKRDEVTAVTEAAMRGELDFAQSLHARVKVLAGLPVSVIEGVRREVLLTPGAAELVAGLKAAGHKVAAVSGGFSQILEPLAEELGLDYALANDLEIVDGKLSGRVLGDVVDRAAKESALRRWSAEQGVDLAHTVAVGDGANDLDMLAAAGLGIAFNAKPAVRAAADAAIDIPYLDVALAIAGVSAV